MNRWRGISAVSCLVLSACWLAGQGVLPVDSRSALAQENVPSTRVPVPVSTYVSEAWDVTWKRFYRDDTHLFYDYLTSYEPGKELQHLPTAEEVQRQFPNECGYGTGMEDCMISAGVMMSLIVDRYAVTREEMLRDRARDVYEGIRLCATGHGYDGFLARGVCHEDLKSIYFNSSRDQFTHAVYGLWLYARSPLCDKETKAEVGTILAAISDRMERNVTPENNFDSLRADGSHDTRGISRMWNVNPHEAARLPMIYAATWDVTRDEKYFDLWRKYIHDAVKQSFGVGPAPTYCFLQMQESLSLLYAVEPEASVKAKIRRIMKDASGLCEERARSAHRIAVQLDLTKSAIDWREENGGLSDKAPYRTMWYCIRESGEAALAQLTDTHTPFPDEQKKLLVQAITRLDYDKVSSNGIFYLQAAYWKALATEFEPVSP